MSVQVKRAVACLLASVSETLDPKPYACADQGRSADEQLAAVIKGFPQVPPLFRRIFPYSKCAPPLHRSDATPIQWCKCTVGLSILVH